MGLTGLRRGGKSKYAMSRIMIASAKMRYFKLRGGGEDGDEAEEMDEIRMELENCVEELEKEKGEDGSPDESRVQ